MTDNFNVSWPVNWPKFVRKQIFIPKRLDSMFGHALVQGWRPFVNKVYSLQTFLFFLSLEKKFFNFIDDVSFFSSFHQDVQVDFVIIDKYTSQLFLR